MNIACHNGKQTTIIMTTHYIEEARQADKVFIHEFSTLCMLGNFHDFLSSVIFFFKINI